ncbi:sensor histidine kinase, partial [Streptomyces sp. NPDC048297]|uniref:sensor histidine kinase n=1 Tax=Streptomyces sp. NPDC048297 TaxID=3365531 RepID=UPI00372227BC
MTIVAQQQSRADFSTWGPWALLGAGAVAAVLSARPVGMDRPQTVAAAALVAAAAVLQTCWARVKRKRPAPGRTGVCLYFLRWAIGFVLSWINPFFAFYAVTGYYTAGVDLPRRLVLPGLFLTAVTMAGSEIGGWPPHGLVLWLGFFLVLAVNMGMVSVFTRYAEREQARTVVQAETIAELERTNAALQQAMDENAALHAQLLVQAREAGVADERRRLAAEIHDTIAQGLTGIIAQLQVVAGAPDLTTARTHLESASALARHSLGEARRSVHNLAPVAGAPPASAPPRACARGFRLHLRFPPAPALSPAAQTARSGTARP